MRYIDQIDCDASGEGINSTGETFPRIDIRCASNDAETPPLESTN